MAISSTSEERGGHSYKPRSNNNYNNNGSSNNNNAGGARPSRPDQGKRDFNKGSRDGAYTPRFKDGDARQNTRNKDNDGGMNQTGGRAGNNNHGKDFKKSYNSNTNNRNDYNRGKDFNNGKDFTRGNERGNERGAAASKETKVKEQQPDKMETIRRLEKEKKVMQKKNDVNNHKAKAQNARPQVKVKRTNNIDWTKEYENDSFEDDDVYYDV